MLGTAAIITGGLGILQGTSKFFEGRRMQRKAEEALAQFEWQNLENPYESLQVSTLGADLQREEAGRFTSTAVDALQQAGTRGLVGGLGRVQQQNTLMNREIGADLDMQQKRIDEMTAGQDVQNQAMFEQRQREELQGLGKQMDTGIDMKYGGLGNIISSSGLVGAGANEAYQNRLAAKDPNHPYNKTGGDGSRFSGARMLTTMMGGNNMGNIIGGTRGKN